MARNESMIRPEIQFQRSFWTEIRIAALREGIPASELVRRAVRSHVKRLGKKVDQEQTDAA